MKNKKTKAAIIAAVVISALLAWLKSSGVVTDPMVLEGIGQVLQAEVAKIEFDTEEETAPSTGAFILEGAPQAPKVR